MSSNPSRKRSRGGDALPHDDALIWRAAFLRAINVGGNNVVKMDALKQAFLACGALSCSTYIQSGNVAFALPQTMPDAAVQSFYDSIVAALRGSPFHIKDPQIMFRTQGDLESVIKFANAIQDDQTSGDADSLQSNTLCYFFEQSCVPGDISKQLREQIANLDVTREKCFSLSPEKTKEVVVRYGALVGIGKFKVTGAVIAKCCQTKLLPTARNIRTIAATVALMKRD